MQCDMCGGVYQPKRKWVEFEGEQIRVCKRCYDLITAETKQEPYFKHSDFCKTCGDVMTTYDKGNGEKYRACYGCYETEEKCTCKKD